MKNLISQLLPILLLTFCLISCKKQKDEVVIYGQIIEYNTDIPLQNIIVTVGYAPCGGESCFEAIKAQKTDASGNYSISISSESMNEDVMLLMNSQDSFYYNQLAYPKHRTILNKINFSDTSSSVKLGRSLIPQSALTVYYEISEPLTSGDVLKIFICSKSGEVSRTYGREFTSQGAGVPDSINYVINAGDQPILISWRRYSYGVGQAGGSEDVPCDEFDGVDFVLNY